MRPSEIAKDFAPAPNQCKDCIYFPKCDEYPFDESGCKDFKDRSRIVELPCKIGQTVYEAVYLRNGMASHINPLKVVGIHIGSFPDLRGHKRKSYLVTVYPTSEILGRVPFDKVDKTIFLTREEAEAALAERRKEFDNESCND